MHRAVRPGGNRSAVRETAQGRAAGDIIALVPGVVVEHGRQLLAGDLRVGAEPPAAYAADDARLGGPIHRVGIPGVSGDVAELRGRAALALLRVIDDLGKHGAGQSGVRRKAAAAHAVHERKRGDIVHKAGVPCAVRHIAIGNGGLRIGNHEVGEVGAAEGKAAVSDLGAVEAPSAAVGNVPNLIAPWVHPAGNAERNAERGPSAVEAVDGLFSRGDQGGDRLFHIQPLKGGALGLVQLADGLFLQAHLNALPVRLFRDGGEGHVVELQRTGGKLKGHTGGAGVPLHGVGQGFQHTRGQRDGGHGLTVAGQADLDGAVLRLERQGGQLGGSGRGHVGHTARDRVLNLNGGVGGAACPRGGRGAGGAAAGGAAGGRTVRIAGGVVITAGVAGITGIA